MDSWLMEHMPDWASGTMVGLEIWKYLGIILCLGAGLVLKKTTRGILGLVKRWVASRSRVRWDDELLDAIQAPAGLAVAAGFWYLCFHGLQLEGLLLRWFIKINQIVFSFALVWGAYRAASLSGRFLEAWGRVNDVPLDDHVVPLVVRALRLAVLIIGGLLALQNLGINVASLVAGLGLGGLAFALAAKDMAANLFGSIMIFLDSPFRLGDWVVFNGVEGTVEDIGFRSTRIRTFYNSLVTVPNATIAGANIDNYGRRQFRRVKATIGVTYDTPPAKLDKFIEAVKSMIMGHPATMKDNLHVVFSGYGASSLDILLYFFLEVPDWSRELMERQDIYMQILKIAEEMGVSFAFPTQTLHVESLPESLLSREG